MWAESKSYSFTTLYIAVSEMRRTVPFAFKLPNLYLSGMHRVSLEPD